MPYPGTTPELVCEHCRNWVSQSTLITGLGECRRYPPTPLNGYSSARYHGPQRFPITDKTHWCGEFNKKSSNP